MKVVPGITMSDSRNSVDQFLGYTDWVGPLFRLPGVLRFNGDSGYPKIN